LVNVEFVKIIFCLIIRLNYIFGPLIYHTHKNTFFFTIKLLVYHISHLLQLESYLKIFNSENGDLQTQTHQTIYLFSLL